MTWAWKSIARGRARLDDVISWSHAGRPSPATWQPRRRGERVKTPTASAFQSKADGKPLELYNAIRSYRIMRPYAWAEKARPTDWVAAQVQRSSSRSACSRNDRWQDGGDMNGEAQTEGPQCPARRGSRASQGRLGACARGSDFV